MVLSRRRLLETGPHPFMYIRVYIYIYLRGKEMSDEFENRGVAVVEERRNFLLLFSLLMDNPFASFLLLLLVSLFRWISCDSFLELCTLFAGSLRFVKNFVALAS